MTTDQLQQKHLQAIENYADFVNTNKKAAAKQCALITIEHTIGVLEEMKYPPASKSNLRGDALYVLTEVCDGVNVKIDSKISELKKQKEQV